jgi:hypothetical protein
MDCDGGSLLAKVGFFFWKKKWGRGFRDYRDLRDRASESDAPAS